jgi:hypothetical protein
MFQARGSGDGNQRSPCMSFRLPLAALLLALATIDMAEVHRDLPLAVAGAVIGLCLLLSDALDAFWLERREARERAIELSNSRSHSR